MRRRAAALALVLCAAAAPAAADRTSPLPPPRPERLVAPLPPAAPGRAPPAPKLTTSAEPEPPGDAAAPASAPPPPDRGAGPAAMAVPAPLPGLPDPGAALPPAGDFCRDPRLVGSTRPTFVGPAVGCGIPGPVAITAAAGVQFSGEVLVDCTTARALADWLMGVVQPSAREVYDGRVAAIEVIGSYACRTRNNAPGARISEHAGGRAVDIAAFRLADGTRVAVESGWAEGETRHFLRRVWEGACGAFGTVLGPDSDRHHRDHLHLDTARYRSGAYCR